MSTHQDLVARCRQHSLSAWEAQFVTDMAARGSLRPPTAKQRATLERIAEGAPDYDLIRRSALTNLQEILSRWLPDGKAIGREWVARNPKRADHHAGSFKVRLETGRWSDFATGDKGGDAISLAAFLFDLKQVEAARRVGAMIGLANEPRE